MNDTLKVDLFQFPTVKINEEPVCKFLACLEQHALVRQLSASTAFWVCAYANNQHHISDDIASKPTQLFILQGHSDVSRSVAGAGFSCNSFQKSLVLLRRVHCALGRKV